MYMTKAMRTGLLGGLLAVLALAVPARAAEEAATPRAYVVLVGISRYDDKAIHPRPHAEDDVKALYDLFTSKDYLGADKDHVRLLLGGAADAGRNSRPATRENILQAARWVADKAKRDDLVIFAFVGQGAALGERADRACYLASDSTVKDMAKDSVLAASLGEALDKVKSQRFCAFVDVDYKGYTPADGKAPAEPNLGSNLFREFRGPEVGEEETMAPGRVVFLATTGGVAGRDADKHGAFAKVVLDGLGGKADQEGYEPDGVVTVDELKEYVDKELPDLERKLGVPDKDRLARHTIRGEDAHYVLTHNPAVEPTVKARLVKFREIARQNNKEITPEIAAEGKNYLERMPKLEAQRALRKDYEKLADGKLTVAKFLEDRKNILEGTQLKRRDAVEFAEKVIDASKLISNDYVKKVNQGEMVAWAIRGLYRKVDEKLPDDLAKKLAGAKDMKERELISLLVDARRRLGKREDLAQHKDIDQALQRMLAHLDPYTTFYDPESLKRAQADIQGRFIGVGISIKKDSNTDMLQVITPIMGSPAYKAGIQAGDLIVNIIREVDAHGKPLDPPEVIPTKGLKIDDAVKKIQGQPGTAVKLTVQRPGEEKPRVVPLKRTLVQMETVMGLKRNEDAAWDYWVDPEGKIGYIRLTQFTRNSYPDMKRVMEKLKKQGVKGLVLDLRFNPGGLLDSARDISGLFIKDGLVVTIRPRVGRPYEMFADDAVSTHYPDFPMVCLVNGGSASGSEIVSAALQDHHRALVLGERSYGKGSVQNVVDFEKDGDGQPTSQIKLTTASFWRPSNKNLNKASTSGKEGDEWGVTPDRAIPLSRAEREELYEHQHNAEIIQPKDKPPSTEDKVEFKDKQLDAAVEYLRGQLKLANKVSSRKAG
jgi:C-terminal peptidase prc